MEREITLPIELYDSIQGKTITRDVTFILSGTYAATEDVPYFDVRQQSSGRYYSQDKQFAAQIGQGEKLHSADGSIIFFKDPEQARKCGWLNFGKKPLFTDADGVMYFFDRNTSIRNRQAHIKTWSDLYVDSPIATKQEYYGSIKGAK
jgi:hypothetical protein